MTLILTLLMMLLFVWLMTRQSRSSKIARHARDSVTEVEIVRDAAHEPSTKSYRAPQGDGPWAGALSLRHCLEV